MAPRPVPTIPMGNIVRSKAVSVAAEDFEDEHGFFIRSGAGNICYLPIGCEEGEAITKTVEAQVYFVDPEMCRKIYSAGTTATGIVVGYGV
jgi:hypothetical protein